MRSLVSGKKCTSLPARTREPVSIRSLMSHKVRQSSVLHRWATLERPLTALSMEWAFYFGFGMVTFISWKATRMKRTRRASTLNEWFSERSDRVYIPLIDEGTEVMRPTFGVSLGGGTYRVLATPAYDPDDEHWKFPPGSVVRCTREMREGSEVLLAQELACDTG
jgi:hypothetical protein